MAFRIRIRLRRGVAIISSLGALFLLLATLACGGEASSAEGIVFDFSDIDDEEAADEAVAMVSPFAGIGLVDLEQGFKVAYLHDMRSLVNDVRTSNRNIMRLGERLGDADLGPAWVVQVFDAHHVSEELRYRSFSYLFADELITDYVDLHADFLRGVEIYTLCADRLIEAALLLGAHPRTLPELSPADRAEFRSLVGESTFYCHQAETRNTRTSELLQQSIGQLRLG